MRMRRRSAIGQHGWGITACRIPLVLLMVMTAAACAAVSPLPSPGIAGLPADASDCQWHFARFRISWPEDTEPRWYVDALLAQEVVAPVLDRHGGDIALWRFHRRARRDDAGHQFSFIFYAAPGPAGRILDALAHHLAAARLVDAGVVAAVSAGTWGGPDGGRSLSATSDANWSEAMQRAWPYYICGVSRLWLVLIGEARADAGITEAPADTDDWLAQYRNIDAAVTATWQNEGRHALLHHLNAIFGYEPIPVVEKRLLRF